MLPRHTAHPAAPQPLDSKLLCPAEKLKLALPVISPLACQAVRLQAVRQQFSPCPGCVPDLYRKVLEGEEAGVQGFSVSRPQIPMIRLNLIPVEIETHF